MSKRISELIRIDPILGNFSTAASTSAPKIRIDGNAKMAIVVSMKAGTVATGMTATAANYVQFAVIEATAASAAGSAISNATVTLGAATAGTVRGAAVGLLKVTSDLTTASEIQINGITYRTTQTGVGTSGEGAAEKLASAINGNATSNKLPHYRAVANWGATGQILVEPDDDLGTGLTLITTGADSTIVPLMSYLQGVIEISPDKLSTNSPKYIGVMTSTGSGSTSLLNAYIVRQPSGSPAFPGRVIDLTT